MTLPSDLTAELRRRLPSQERRAREPAYIRPGRESGRIWLTDHLQQGRRGDYLRRSAHRSSVEPTTAFLVASLLRDVVDAGTEAPGSDARDSSHRLALKNWHDRDDYKDAWFVGFTPELAAGVWIGFDQPSH